MKDSARRRRTAVLDPSDNPADRRHGDALARRDIPPEIRKQILRAKRLSWLGAVLIGVWLIGTFAAAAVFAWLDPSMHAGAWNGAGHLILGVVALGGVAALGYGIRELHDIRAELRQWARRRMDRERRP